MTVRVLSLYVRDSQHNLGSLPGRRERRAQQNPVFHHHLRRQSVIARRCQVGLIARDRSHRMDLRVRSSEAEKNRWLQDLKSAIDNLTNNSEEQRNYYTSTIKSNGKHID